MLTAALLTIARTRKQPRCPSTDGWIKKIWYVNTTESYPPVTRNTSESVSMRMNPEAVTQSEVSQKEKDTYILAHTCGI